MTKPLPRGIRNNNPGNVERGNDRWLGMCADQSSDSRFLVFDTPEAGIRCLMRLLINYQERHGIKTMREAINRWAPPVENNSSAYVQHVSRLTGFDPDEPLDFLDREINVALTEAIVRHENGEPTIYGRKEWYPADTYERAAVMAGFEPTKKPLVKSRTVAGAVIAATGVAVGAATGAQDVATDLPITPQDVTLIAGALTPFLSGALLQYLSPIATLAGVALAVYARWDDARRKLR